MAVAVRVGKGGVMLERGADRSVARKVSDGMGKLSLVRAVTICPSRGLEAM